MINSQTNQWNKVTENKDNCCEGKKKGVLIERDSWEVGSASLESQHLSGDLDAKLLACYKWWLRLPGRENSKCKGLGAGTGMET